ncbi:MAG TPA: DUF881 domain-containing protein [Nocardioidaceae bacterium]|nr:DUF881 domain-containing protein [Nocardioidaceae bacterium]
MTETPRSRRPALLTRESWARRIAAARRTRSRTYRNRGLIWRALVPLGFILAGILFVTSAVSSDGTDLRAGRFGDLSTVVRQATKEADELRAERSELAREVEELTADLGQSGVTKAQRKVEELRVPSGLAAMRGPGLTVELDDASAEDIDAATGVEPELLIVHQQDIQGVVNAMWAGGAEAMTIQGQRVISTTGIKCIGNTVLLHGMQYSPPYVITAVGDPAAMLAAINESPYIDIYLDYVEAYGLGWDVLPHADVALPAYEGSLDLEYARPVGEDGRLDAEGDI